MGLLILQWRIQGRGSGGPAPPFFLDQTEAQRAKRNFFWRQPPPPLSMGLYDRASALSQGLDPALFCTFLCLR